MIYSQASEDDSILREEDKLERRDRADRLIGKGFKEDKDNFSCCVRIALRRRHFASEARILTSAVRRSLTNF